MRATFFIDAGLTFTTDNNAAERDPVSYELSGSNAGIEGPFTLIAAGNIVDFSQATAWPRFTANEAQISFDNTVAYGHYQLIVTAVRDTNAANSMQIAKVELNGTIQQICSDVTYLTKMGSVGSPQPHFLDSYVSFNSW
jgi:hypothetical protein